MRAATVPVAPFRRLLRTLALAVPTILVGRAEAGHELPFYPSYYPQEIRIETLTPRAAAPQLKKGTLHAYVGRDPLAGARLPADIRAVESLDGYLVVGFNPASAVARSRESRCEAARGVARGLTPAPDAWTLHPYPVTPYHMDYLEHFDVVRTLKKSYEAGAPLSGGSPRIRAKGVLVDHLVRASSRASGKDWDVSLEVIDLPSLLAAGAVSMDGWLGPPWIKEGWFHAYLLQSGAVSDPASKREVDAIYRKLTTGDYQGLAERMDLERKLVGDLVRGCERAVVGYTLRRELYNSEFSQGIENVGRDSLTGFNSAIFVRTVKLKDFPWNGWLRLGMAARPVAAWNPIAGFSDPAGRLMWAAVGDPAMLPSPGGSGWVSNRAMAVSVAAGADLEVPADALLPEPGTGLVREEGKGKTARAKVVYRLKASAFHDDTRMTPADAIYPYLFAARWGVKGASGGDYDPAVDTATASERQWLAGFKVLGVDTEVQKYSDITFTYVVPVIEVYLNLGAEDPQQVAAAAPPWSAVPWHVIVLMEEAVKRGLGAFSAEEASRRGIRWLDLARDAKTKNALASLVDDFAARAYVPPALKRFVNADEAQNRWNALKQFYRRHGHFLVTNGPYRLDKWPDGAVVLQVFRDFTNPLGVGAFDRFAIPRRAYVSRLEAAAERLQVQAEIERVEKFLRDHRIVREPLASPAAGGDREDVPVCRYAIVDGAGAIVAAGSSEEVQGSKLIVNLKGKLKPGVYTAIVALSLGDNWVNPEIATAEYRVEATP